MSDIESASQAVVNEADIDPAVRDKLNIDAADFKEKMKYIGMQIDMLKPNERIQFQDEFKDVTKTLNSLRKVLSQKQREEQAWYEFNWLMIACVVGLLLVFAFFGYKLYRSLTERDRRRQEKLLAKQNKSKKK